MNPDSIEKIFKAASEIKLDEKKKDAIHQEVLIFVKNNPIKPLKRGWFNFDVFRSKTPMIALASIMLLFVAGGITVVKADAALPGDALYPVKLGFNEKAKEILAFSSQAKLELNVRLAEVRLQEAEKLKAEGKLNNVNEVQINSNFKNHTEKAFEYISKKKGDKKIKDTAGKFEASLKAHDIIFNSLKKDTKDAVNEVVNPIGDDIEKAVSKISAINSDDDDTKHDNDKDTIKIESGIKIKNLIK